MISQRLKAFVTDNEVLTKNQHGFRKAHSTITAISTLLHKVYNNINNKEDTYLVFLDLKKAFDTVSHNILLNKLGNSGIDLKTLDWFASYLINRKQMVQFNHETSSIQNVCYGVPQGSILGPTLFSLYINDLSELLLHNNITLYADDTVLYSSNSDYLQEILDKVKDWCDDNLLTINCKKSQWMQTRIIKKKQDNTSLRLGNISLDQVSEYKYLGILIDTDLSFKPQRDSLHKKVNLKLTFFRRIRKYINAKAALTIYKSTILPIIEYADFIYDYNVTYVSNNIQSMQNQGLSTVYEQYRLHYTDRESTETLHRKAKLYRLIHRRKLHLLSYSYTLTKDDKMMDNREIHTR